MTNNMNIAKAWRRANPDCVGGYVLIHNGLAFGWKAELSRPETVCPGARAVATDGSEFVAEGGDEFKGAERWTAVRRQTTLRRR